MAMCVATSSFVSSFLSKGIKPSPTEIGRARAIYQGLRPLMGNLYWCQPLGAGRFELRIRVEDGSWEFHGGRLEDFRALYRALKDGSEPEVQVQVQPQAVLDEAPLGPQYAVEVDGGMTRLRYTTRKGACYTSPWMGEETLAQELRDLNQGRQPWRLPGWTKS